MDADDAADRRLCVARLARYGLNYGPLRLWGSAAFVVGALACGLLVDLIAAEHLIWVIAAVARSER